MISQSCDGLSLQYIGIHSPGCPARSRHTTRSVKRLRSKIRLYRSSSVANKSCCRRRGRYEKELRRFGRAAPSTRRYYRDQSRLRRGRLGVGEGSSWSESRCSRIRYSFSQQYIYGCSHQAVDFVITGRCKVPGSGCSGTEEPPSRKLKGATGGELGSIRASGLGTKKLKPLFDREKSSLQSSFFLHQCRLEPLQLLSPWPPHCSCLQRLR